MGDEGSLPEQFDPARKRLTGSDVLRYGLPDLPEVLTREMSIPVAFWTAKHSGVVLFLEYSRGHGGSLAPMVWMGSYARGNDGWTAHKHWHGGSWDHDPIADPEWTDDLGGLEIAGGGDGVFTDDPRAGCPASTTTARVSAAVTAIAVIQDGREDRRDLRSYFGAVVFCTEQSTPYQINALDVSGAVIGSIHGPPRFS